MGKTVLITGVSGGVGLSTAKIFALNGFRVFGLDINEPKDNIDNLHFYKCDLTNEKDVINSFNLIKNGCDSLDYIINTAGIYRLNSLVEISEEEFIKIFNVNVFSIYRVNKNFLPLLKEKGKIIMISSELAPLDPLPFTGLYAITKSTIEKYAYSLRMELQLLGYQVVLIRPGAIDTNLIDVSTEQLEEFNKNTKYYQHDATKFKKIVNSVEAKKVSPDRIGKLIYKVSQKKHPKYVYKINRNKLLLLLNILPKRWQNKIIKNVIKK